MAGQAWPAGQCSDDVGSSSYWSFRPWVFSQHQARCTPKAVRAAVADYPVAVVAEEVAAEEEVVVVVVVVVVDSSDEA
jgi:hypothetical protein